MKKITLLATAALLLSTAAVKANNDHKKVGNEKAKVVTTRVENSFQQDFNQASNISWKQQDNFYFASFVQNGQTLDAAYNNNGELVGISKKVNVSNLPALVQMSLEEKFAKTPLPTTAIEITLDGSTNYYLNVTTQQGLVPVKVTEGGYITIEKSVK